MNIVLTDKEMQDVSRFAKLSCWTQQSHEFGQAEYDRRLYDTMKDTMVGKAAEVAVSRMLRTRYGLHNPLDFDIYDEIEGDDYDIRVGRWDVDIKATEKGRWLLIDRDRLAKRKETRRKVDGGWIIFNTLPDAFVFCTVKENVVTIHGFVSLVTYLESAERLPKGSCIPNTTTKLQAANFGLTADKLCGDWDLWIKILNDPPSKNIDIPRIET